MGKIIHHYDQKAIFDFRQAVKRLAGELNAESDVVVCALADVVADVAALLDRQGGSHTLADRMDSFNARVEETYARVRNTMDTVDKAQLLEAAK